MHRKPSPPRIAFASVVSSLILLPLATQAQVAAAKPGGANADAVAACERAAGQSLASQAAPASELSFDAAPTVDPTLSNENQVVLRGAGRWRAASGPRSFSYSCNVDLRAPESVGLVMRDSTPAAAQAASTRTVEPDLSHLSPAACESSAAVALRQRWPGVSQISFDGATRTLRQESPSKAELHGQGRALPAPGSPSAFFGFDCEVDPRDGRVLGTRISG